MEVIRQSVNVSKRRIKPLGIIIHHTAGPYIGSVEWCLNPVSKVSYHAIVNINGHSTVLAKDDQRAWHAGDSSFNGRTGCNDFMLGIAVTGDTNRRELTIQEIEAVAQWCVKKMKLYNIKIAWITTHKKVSPRRKKDVSDKAYNEIIAAIKRIF